MEYDIFSDSNGLHMYRPKIGPILQSTVFLYAQLQSTEKVYPPSTGLMLSFDELDETHDTSDWLKVDAVVPW